MPERGFDGHTNLLYVHSMFHSQGLGTQRFVTWQFIHALSRDALTSEINNNETQAEAMELDFRS